jgi:spore maturation protein CgeB
MKVLIISPEHIKKNERYLDDKGWSFSKAFNKLDIHTEAFFYKKKGALSFLEKKKVLRKAWHAFMNKKLVSQVRAGKYDVILILKGETILAESLWEIRRNTDTIIVNVFPDNPLYLGNFAAIAPCHYYFVKDSYVLNTLMKAGLNNVLYLPQCTDPDVHKPLALSEQDRSVFSSNLTLLGSMYPYRLKLVQELTEFDLSIWGRGWKRSKDQKIIKKYRDRDIRGTQKTKAINASVISLNPHHPINDIYGVNRRTYDIAACKAFQLADQKKDMESILKTGEEIICYKSMDDLKKLIVYYLDHPDERMEIAEAAYRRVIRDHTYDNRASHIIDIIKSEN